MSDVNLKATQETTERGGAIVSTAAKNLQTFAAECAEISRQSLDHASQTLEKMRAARGASELLAIQTQYLRECFENYAQHSRRFAELVSVLPVEIGKSYTDVLSKTFGATTDAARQATEQTASNVERLTKP